MKVINLKAKPPIVGADMIDQQISAAHKYQNNLIEINRAFAADRLEAKRKHIPGLVEAEADAEAGKAALDDLRDAVKRRNAIARRKTATPEDQQAIAQAKESLNAAYVRRKELMAQAASNLAYQEDLAALIIRYQGEIIYPEAEKPRRRGGLLKDARKTCGVYSGTYLRVEAAVEQAINTTRGELRFARWDGGGIVGPQLKPPLLWSDLLKCESQDIRMEIISAKGGSRLTQRVLFWVRVNSDAKRKPIWAKIQATLPVGVIPADPKAKIKWASIVRRQAGMWRQKCETIPEGIYRPYYEWSVQLTVDCADEKPRAETGACGINLGYRLEDDGSLLIATAIGNDGVIHRFHLPERLMSRWKKVRDIQEIRGRRFNEARDKLVVWLASEARPEWLTEMTESLVQWRSHRRLCRVIAKWAETRFPGDDDMFAVLSAWRDKEMHLEEYQIGLEQGTQRRRKALYQQFVAKMRQTYARIAVDKTSQKKLMRRPKAESNDAVNETAKRNARYASPGMLRQLFANDGALLIDPKDFTGTCHVCGSIDEWDRAKDRRHVCSSCGAEWDQDENHARNLLASASVRDETPGVARSDESVAVEGDTETEPKKGGKWARRAEARSKRLAERAAG